MKRAFITLLATFLVIFLSLFTVGLASERIGRALAGMVWGLNILWVGVGGLTFYVLRAQLARLLQKLPGGWKTQFVLGATMFALIEEMVSVGMTNLAPFFGARVGEVYITASANYFDVVLFHSVIMFVPFFIGTAFLMKRYDFRPFSVFLLFGILGTFLEAMFAHNILFLFAFPQWIFVYGLMVFIPACAVPLDRGARPVRWWHYFIAIPYVFLIGLPLAAVEFFIITVVLHHPALHFLPITIGAK